MTIKISTKIKNKYKPFVTRWLLTTDNTITLPLSGGFNYNFDVDWGDGTTASVTAFDDVNITHTYSTSGIKTVSINGNMSHWGFANSGDKLKIIDVIHGGYTGLKSLRGGFEGCSNLVYVENSNWTRDVTDFYRTFSTCTSLLCDISKWDVSKGINFQQMFYNCDLMANMDISQWDVSNAQIMISMFTDIETLNIDISKWDVSNVTTMQSMFSQCINFNANISNWDTSNVIDMNYMFWLCPSFNQDITKWDISNVMYFSNMFGGCTLFNQNIGLWDFSSVPASSTHLSDFINNTSMSITNYNTLLQTLDATGIEGVTLGASGVNFSSAAETARNSLISKGWTIIDAGIL